MILCFYLESFLIKNNLKIFLQKYTTIILLLYICISITTKTNGYDFQKRH